MARMRVIINKVISVVLYISLNKLTDWAIEVLPCSLTDASNIAHIALPNINAPTVASTKRNLCNIQDSDKVTLGFYSSIRSGKIELWAGLIGFGLPHLPLWNGWGWSWGLSLLGGG